MIGLIMVSNTIADKIAQYKAYKDLQEKFNNEIEKFLVELKNSCDGTCGNYVKLRIYTPSTYYDSAYDTIYMNCKICGKSEYLGTM